MLDSLSPARRRLLGVVIGLVVLAAVAVVAVAVVRSRSEALDATQDRPGPVVLVPGYGGDVDDLDPLVTEVRRAGRTAVVFTPPGGGTGDLRAQARALGTLVERTLRDQDARSVDLVGYSAGGVVVRLFVRDDGGADVVRRVLTIGSPHHGTDIAALAQQTVGSCPTACEQLAPTSDVLRRLNAGDETPAGPRWVTVRSDFDRTVIPTDTATLDGALNLDVQDLCPRARTSHGRLPGDPVTLAALDQAIGASTPRRPEVACGGAEPSNDASASPSSASSSSAASCPGGEVRFLQGAPTDLPGGGSGGIGQVYVDADPPTVDLAIGAGDQTVDVPRKLPVGGRFLVVATTYRVTCISRSKVTVERVSGPASSPSPASS